MEAILNQELAKAGLTEDYKIHCLIDDKRKELLEQIRLLDIDAYRYEFYLNESNELLCTLILNHTESIDRTKDLKVKDVKITFIKRSKPIPIPKSYYIISY